MVLRRHPAIGDRAAAVGIDPLHAAGNKPGPEGGKERTDLANQDQKGVQQTDDRPAEQGIAHRGLPRQVPGFQGHQRKGGAKVERDAHREIDGARADDEGHRHRHNQQNRAALQQVCPVINGEKYRVSPAEQGNSQQGDNAEARPRQIGQRAAGGLLRR